MSQNKTRLQEFKQNLYFNNTIRYLDWGMSDEVTKVPFLRPFRIAKTHVRDKDIHLCAFI